jgi:Cdc6-like AAA superfamily ATPase
MRGAYVPTEQRPNDDDFDEEAIPSNVSAMRRRANVVSKEEYCALMRLTNSEQRELILEVRHRLHKPDREPIQVFFTGPAGCGKTFTLKALMETYNRYTQEHNSMHNAYVACASTGKAAVALGGVTVHAAFRLTISRQTHQLSREVLQTYRHLLGNVNCVIIDEVSMCSSHLFYAVNSRLQAMTGVYDTHFGGLDLFACGDLKQHAPVSAAPVYRATRRFIAAVAISRSL